MTKIPDGAQVISVAAADMSEGEVRRAASEMMPKVLANPERYQEGKGAFLAQALGSVYHDEIRAGDAARDKKKSQQDMFPEGTDGG